MTGELRTIDDDGPQRCTFCPEDAAGPCATCRRPVCGDCCTITEGSVRAWAICLDCDRKGGRSLTSAWGGLLFFVFKILAVLAAIVALLAWLSS